MSKRDKSRAGASRGGSSGAGSFGAPEPGARSAAEARELAMAGDAFYLAGRHTEAHRRFEAAMELEPSNAAHPFKVAVCEWALGQWDSVNQHLRRAIELNPRMAVAHEWLSQAHLQAGLVEPALEHSAIAMSLAPHDAGIRASRAVALETAGDVDEAWGLVKGLLNDNYKPARVVSLYARMAPSRGEAGAALALVEQLLTAGVGVNSALHFAAAELFDAAGRYDEAFEHAAKANALATFNFNAPAHQRSIDIAIAYFTPQRIKALPRAMYRDRARPVFIVGMPRSGTSLVEQILASHPLIHGAGELDFINRIASGALDMLRDSASTYPQCLDGLSIDRADGLAQVYLAPVSAMRADARIVIDKMPTNFMHLGLIAALLPEARIIHCRRNPLDTCLSCHMTHFGAGHEFTRDLVYLAGYYRQYQRLMAHWQKVLDLPMLEVDYEAVIADLPGQARRLVEFTGCDWDDRCLNFHQTKRPVTTASLAQVRRPIYGTSVERWRHYERHLGPLRGLA